MGESEGERKEGGASERYRPRSGRRRGAQVGTNYYTMRCPACRHVQLMTHADIPGGPEPWEVQPYLKCEGCGGFEATTAWAIIIWRYEPLHPSAQDLALRLHPCAKCDHPVIHSRQLCRSCEG